MSDQVRGVLVIGDEPAAASIVVAGAPSLMVAPSSVMFCREAERVELAERDAVFVVRRVGWRSRD
jgi:hypothetical protein